jgi:sugar O-acyltransferase (sialic acid O-acetyltransferase NeuD family)
MVRPLGIFTAGGLARAVASHFSDENVLWFIDEPRKPNETIGATPVLPQVPYTPKMYARYVIACGEPKRRKTLAEENDVEWATLIHKNATVSRRAEIREGSVICPGVVIDPEVTIGKHVYIDHNAVVGHNAYVGDYTVIGPLVLIAGYCQIMEGAYIGTGAKIVKEARIGFGAVIGAGAVVLEDVPAYEVWAGVPARKIK